jgi:putative ABC transport system permease protein
MKEPHPPKWADRFLAWYCNPDLLEEIQGDAWQLYFDRLQTEGKARADRKYFWDVIRFCRWSNIRKPATRSHSSNVPAVWNFTFKLAIRNAGKNKTIFGIKIISLALSLAFAILLNAYVVNEITFDRFHTRHKNIYRVTSSVTFPDHKTHYAVTPLPLGSALTEAIPEVESFSRFMYEERAVFRIGENTFPHEKTLAADTNFLRIFTFEYIQGSREALDGPDKIVLTENLARKFFGHDDPIGKTIEFGEDMLLEVTGVIKNVPANSHLQFDAIISWDSFKRYDAWGNLNAYTYILLRQDATIEGVQKKLPDVVATFHDLIARDYNAIFEPVLENIADIHFARPLDEDIAQRRSKTNIYILSVVVFLFLIGGLVNYLNLSLTEISASLRKIGIIRVFGGMDGGHSKIVLSDVFFTALVIAPLVVAFVWTGRNIGRDFLSINIASTVLTNPIFVGMIAGFFLLLAASSRLNSLILSRAGHVIACLQGRLNKQNSGTAFRKILVGVQLCFSIIMIAVIILIVDQFRFIQEADKGFDDKNTVIIKLPREKPHIIETFTEELRSVPGIVKTDGSSYYPGIIETKYVFEVETDNGMEQLLVPMMICGHDYLDVLDVKVAQGRAFQREHLSDEQSGYIVNETAAREFGWKNAVGKRIRGPLSGDNEAYRDGTVIGVIKDFNFATLHNSIEPVIIFLTDDNWGSQFIYAKLDPIHPDNLIRTIESKFKEQWPDKPFDWEYLDSKYLSLYKEDFEVKDIFEIGLVISIIISCLGIFSISALANVLRTKEMGIRKVVGASSLHLFYLHIKSPMYFTILASIAASPAIWFAADQWLQNFAYHVPVSWKYFVLPGILALALTLITSGYHGIKGSNANLVSALKHE